jgi:hypothetical protein
MSFQLVEYDELVELVKQSIISELTYHGIKIKKINTQDNAFEMLREGLKTLFLTHPVRSVQGQYLLAIIEYFHNLNIQEIIPEFEEYKKLVLNSATYYIQQKIFKSYKVLYCDRSNFFNALTTSLRLNKGNTPDFSEIHELYTVLYDFSLSQRYKDADLRECLEPEKQIFLKIEGFNIDKFFKDLVKKIACFAEKQIEATGKHQSSTPLYGKKPRSHFFGKHNIMNQFAALSVSEEHREELAVHC